MEMNKSMLAAYQDRWRVVAEAEIAEQRQNSAAQSWRELNSIVRLAAGLSLLQKDDDAQVDIVRDRWNLLKKLYVAKLQG